MADDAVLSQPQAAAVADMTPRRLRQLDKEDSPPPKNDQGQYPAAEFGRWLRHRHIAGLGVTDDGEVIDYERERARLTREQADNTALKNAQLRRESAPIAVIEWTLGRVLAQAAATLDAIPVKVKRRLPKLSAAEIEIIKREIAKVRNLAARVQVDIDEYRADQRTDDRD